MARSSGFGIGLAAVLIAVLVWGTQLPVAKVVLTVMDSVTLTALRYAIAASLLVPLLWLREGSAAFAPGPRPWALVGAGLVGMAASPLLVFVGLAYTTPEHAVLILALQPSMSAVAQWLFRGVRPPLFTIGSIIAAFCGVVLVVTGHGSSDGGKVLGDLLVAVGAACWVTYTLMLTLFPGMSALRFTTLSLSVGTSVTVLVALVSLLLGMARLPTMPEAVAIAPHILFLALAGVTASMVMWNFGSARIGALNSILLLNLMPVETYLIRYLQGAHFTAQEWCGGALVITALVANNLYQRRQRTRAEAHDRKEGHKQQDK